MLFYILTWLTVPEGMNEIIRAHWQRHPFFKRYKPVPTTPSETWDDAHRREVHSIAIVGSFTSREIFKLELFQKAIFST